MDMIRTDQFLGGEYAEPRALHCLVDTFSAAMDGEIRDRRLRGKVGWDDDSQDFRDAIKEHLERDDFIGVANLAMFQWNIQNGFKHEADLNDKAFGSTRSNDGRYPI